MKRLLYPCMLACGLGQTGPALAHPHVFVDAETAFLFDEAGRLDALHITWTYDAFTSLSLFEILDLDADRDGQLNDADRAAIVEGETNWPEGYNGDTHLEFAGTSIGLTRPEEASASMDNDQITVAFTLPLASPLDIEGEALLLLYDPTYYYAYTVMKVGPAAPENCVSELTPFSADQAAAELQRKLSALSREETPEIEDVGRLFSDEIRLICE